MSKASIISNIIQEMLVDLLTTVPDSLKIVSIRVFSSWDLYWTITLGDQWHKKMLNYFQ